MILQVPMPQAGLIPVALSSAPPPMMVMLAPLSGMPNAFVTRYLPRNEYQTALIVRGRSKRSLERSGIVSFSVALGPEILHVDDVAQPIRHCSGGPGANLEGVLNEGCVCHCVPILIRQ